MFMVNKVLRVNLQTLQICIQVCMTKKWCLVFVLIRPWHFILCN